MKGGDVLALGALRAFAKRPELYDELALLLVCDEEWRTADFGHVERFAGFDACLCFEAGELTGDAEGVVVRRKAAGTVHVTAHGRSAHCGSAPTAAATRCSRWPRAAQVVAAQHDPHGPQHLTAVPTVMRSGDAFNVVPGAGELFCDVRADELEAIEHVLEAIPVDGRRRPPGRRADPPLAGHALRGRDGPRAGARLRGARPPIAPASRGGASDASHFAATIPITVDGLGPRGGKAHNPEEFVLEASLQPRAEVALAVILSALTL